MRLPNRLGRGCALALAFSLVAPLTLAAAAPLAKPGAPLVVAPGLPAPASPVSGRRPPPDAGLRQDWAVQALAAIAAKEYQPARSAAGWWAPNREQALESTWDGGRWTVRPRVSTASWTFEYDLTFVGRDGGAALALPAAGEPSVVGSRVEWPRGSVLEWYVNGPSGIEQGFEILERPDGDLPLVVEGRVRGLGGWIDAAGESITFRRADGADALRLAHLIVRDATGRELPACMEAGPGVLRYVVDDVGATYPLSVDPLATSPSWEVEGDRPGGAFATDIATAGDVDGDGYSDVIVGDWQYPGAGFEGRVWLFRGGPSGPSTTPDWIANAVDVDRLGVSVGTAGDVNGDGFADVIAGAPFWADTATFELRGAALVWHGSAAGLPASPTAILLGENDNDQFGLRVAPAGDVNGDGFDDVLVGAGTYSNGEFSEGAVYAYHGSASGLSAAPDWRVEGEWELSAFGRAIATAGDVNADGYDDVIVGAANHDNPEIIEGRAYVYLGSNAGLSTTATWIVEGNQTAGLLGWQVATAGDANGDGYADVIVGMPGKHRNGFSQAGEAYVYLGSPTGPSPTPDWVLVGEDQNHFFFGLGVDTAGDVNGDGLGDVLVGTDRWDNGQTDEGRAYAFLGQAVGQPSSPWWTVESDVAQSAFATQIGTAGDVNGDGFSDVLVGAPSFDGSLTQQGKGYLYFGGADSLADDPEWTREGQAAWRLGAVVAMAGDVNGDGFSDALITAGGYENAPFARGRVFAYHGSPSGLPATEDWSAGFTQPGNGFGTTAAAGDVNGDGYDDVLIGASSWDDDQPNEGRAFVYLGSAAGLDTAPAWTDDGDDEDSTYGGTVAGAGDVNADGFADILVGAMTHGTPPFGTGKAYLYLGSATGPSPTPSWEIVGGQGGAMYGAVGSAGDVNADGYSDVLVGARFWGNDQPVEGRAFLYLGSAAGPSTTPDWTSESDQQSSNYGERVGSAGDVDGDGFSDVFVGGHGYDFGGGFNNGILRVYHGSATGLGPLPAFTAIGQDGSDLGRDASTAGDVNGDGYSDLVVAAEFHDAPESQEGAAFLWLGSATGLAAAPAWSFDSDAPGARLGRVAGGGDVDGDGFSDILLGAPSYSVAPGGLEGRVYFFQGNARRGLDRAARQAPQAGPGPLALFNLIGRQGFELRVNGRSPYGRDQVRLEWQVAPLGTPLGGAALSTSSWEDTGAPGPGGSVVALSEVQDFNGAPTPPLGPYTWRLRLRSKGPFPWQSHWMGVPGNALTEKDVELAGPGFRGKGKGKGKGRGNGPP